MADSRQPTTDTWSAWLAERGPALLLFARQWVPAVSDAEDVVQEAFIRFWRSRQQAADPSAYLFTCVKNAANEWHRGRGRRARREEAVARPEAELFHGPQAQQERRAMIEAALGRLPEAQREVLVMKIWGGLTFPQVAEALAIPANTAASRYRYALDRLREELAEEPIA